MEVIRAQDTHVPGIVDVWEEFALFHESVDPRYPMVDDVRTGFEKYLRGLLMDENTLVFTVLDDGKVVGFSVSQIRKSMPGFKREKYGEIGMMGVRTEYRRRGVGTHMLGKIMDWFRSQKIDMIELSVASENKVGYPSWRKHGFNDYQHRLCLKTHVPEK